MIVLGGPGEGGLRAVPPTEVPGAEAPLEGLGQSLQKLEYQCILCNGKKHCREYQNILVHSVQPYVLN